MSVATRSQPYFTISGLAELFAVTPRTIYREIERGQLRPVRVGRRIRFTPEEVARYLAREDRSCQR